MAIAEAKSPRLGVWPLFGLVSVLWGASYSLISLSLHAGFTVGTVALGRVAVAAAVLSCVPSLRPSRALVARAWKPILAVALLNVAFPFTAIALAQTRLPSSSAGVLVASTPLWVALLAIRMDHSERASAVQLLGIVIGLLGILLLLGFAGSGLALAWGGVLVLLAAAGYAAAALLVKRQLDNVPIGPLTTSTLGVAAVVLLPVGLADLPGAVPSYDGWVALAGLGAVCTAAAFGSFYVLIQRAGVGRAILITYLAPVVSLFLGVLAFGEVLGPVQVAAVLLVLGGARLASRVPDQASGSGSRRSPDARSTVAGPP